MPSDFEWLLSCKKELISGSWGAGWVSKVLTTQKHLSSDPQLPRKSQVWWREPVVPVWLYKPVVRALERSLKDLQGLLARQPCWIYELHIQWECLSWEKEMRGEERRRKEEKQRAIEEDTFQLLGFTCSCTLIHIHLHTCVHTDENIAHTVELVSDKQPYKRSTGYQLLGSFLIAMYILLEFLFHSPLLFLIYLFYFF